jgi:hypothetical protein
MPIEPAMLARSIATLTDLDPQQDLAATLQQAVAAAKRLFDADPAGVMLVDVDGSLRWASASDQRAQHLEDNQEVFAAGPCAEAFTGGRPAVMHDATLEPRWGEIALTFVEVGCPDGTRTPGRAGGPHPPAPGGQGIGPTARRRGPRGRRRPAPAPRANQAAGNPSGTDQGRHRDLAVG